MLVAFGAICQETAKTAAANKNPKELTIDGIPYSQYKAQQDASKKQQALKDQQAMQTRFGQQLTVGTAKIPDVEPAQKAPVKKQPVPAAVKNTPVINKQQAAQNKAQLEEITLTIPDAKSAAVKKPEVRKPVLATEAEVQQYVKENTKVAEKPKVVEQPAAVSTPSRLQSAMVTEADAPVVAPANMQTTSADSKVKPAEAPLQANPSVNANANLSVGAVSTEEAYKAEKPVSELPKTTLNQEAQKTEAEIPASAAPEKIKVPAKPSQNGGN